jgi:hypothetical protein
MGVRQGESSSAFEKFSWRPKMMVERWLMRKLFQLAHDRLPHLLGADDLAALRLDVGGAQALARAA